ncbi:VOC family protein [Frankia sp. CcWB2]
MPSRATPLYGVVVWITATRRPAPREITVEIKELGHLVLYVRDIGRSSAFYRDVLGWRDLSRPGGRGRQPTAGPRRRVLLRTHPPRAAPHRGRRGRGGHTPGPAGGIVPLRTEGWRQR